MIVDVTGIIFDLDGVLVNTAAYHFECWRQLAAEFGKPFTPDQGEGVKGVSREDALAYVLEVCGIEVAPERTKELATYKDALFKEMIAKLTPAALLPGAAEALRWLAAQRIPVALASSSANARQILARTGITAYFDVIVDGDMITRTKPDPQIFLLAAALLGLEPARCVVVEDAVAGVAGALAAGCKVIGIGSPTVLSAADLVVPAVGHIPLSEIFRTPSPNFPIVKE
ncbi:MAG: beta-phosphoglucomutase [Propionibacteriaceae bacterium]|jgi:beta-phosphoglucomutase|nr:beta-phosphoglucomutase [Propionibacteriaceae bacterium]